MKTTQTRLGQRGCGCGAGMPCQCQRPTIEELSLGRTKINSTDDIVRLKRQPYGSGQNDETESYDGKPMLAGHCSRLTPLNFFALFLTAISASKEPSVERAAGSDTIHARPLKLFPYSSSSTLSQGPW